MQGFGGITKRHRQDEDHLYPQPVGAIEVRQRDGIATFERTLQVLAGVTLAAIIIVLAVGCGPSDVEVIAAQVAAADALKGNVSAEDHAAVILLSHPLPYAATIRQSGDGISEPRTRYYIPASAR